jgi:hypothetical protein
MHASKVGDLPLFTIVATLAVAWLVAVAGLSLTIKREYLRRFVSFQTGCAYAQSYFLDNEGHDAKRVEIFFHNMRQWQAIRNRVREWVLGVYAVWKALMPSWFTTDLQARIPDEFMPTQVVHELNAQATLQNMGLLRRVSQAAAVTAEESSSSDGGSRIPAPTAATHGLHGGNAVHLDAAAEVQSSLKPGGGLASLKLGNRSLVRMMETYDLMYTPKMWTATDERSLRRTESYEVSKLAPIIPHRLASGLSAVKETAKPGLRGVCARVRAGVCVCACVCVFVFTHGCACRSAVRPTASGPSRA